MWSSIPRHRARPERQRPSAGVWAVDGEEVTKDDNGKTLATAPRVAAPYSTAVFDHDAEEADGLVQRTIAANLGKAGHVAAVPRLQRAAPVATGASNAPAAISAKAPAGTPF
jgi:hypothetical protein